jgi:hypothetical protein
MVNAITMTNAIELAEREIQRDKDDLKRLKKRYPGYDFVPVDPKKTAENQPQRAPKTDFTDLELAVLAVVAVGVDKEWTSREVFESLRAQGVRLPEKEEAAMNAVGAALIELKDADKILRSFEGKGRAPHRYSAILKEKEATPEEIAS